MVQIRRPATGTGADELARADRRQRDALASTYGRAIIDHAPARVLPVGPCDWR